MKVIPMSALYIKICAHNNAQIKPSDWIRNYAEQVTS